MQLIEVTSKAHENLFIQVNIAINGDDPNYIRPLDKDVNDVFNPAKNKTFRFGEVKRWFLMDNNKKPIGRIAAFTNSKYTNKGDEQPTGGIGFFDCINNQAAANLLFDASKNWLLSKGMEAMDGPINFGERDRWWGLVISGFHPPLYAMNYNKPYYQQLFENYGFRIFFNQICFGAPITTQLSKKFTDAHAKFAGKPEYTVKYINKEDVEKFANDFCTVYNKAWASHEGNKQMEVEEALKLFKTMKPVMDEKIVWFAYYKDEPMAMYINLPDLNQIFKYLNGQFGALSKLKFLWYKKFRPCTRFVGIVYGVVPRFQGTGLDYYMIVEAAKVIQGQLHYTETELQWQGDFNPKMLNISKHIGMEETRRLATFRYLFDRNKEFKRHPIL
jgi:hypothetical protein